MELGDDLEKVKVEAKIAGHERGPKIRVFKYRPKKGYRRRAGHRSELTRLEITDVKMLSRKPASRSSGTQSSGGARKQPAKKEESDGS
jgi:large subunit ribosomal protein L21